MDELQRWFETVRRRLAIGDDALPADARDRLLDLTRDVAHDVARPAAPLTAFLVGLAVGAGRPLEDAVETVRRLAAEWNTTQPESAS
ncbi:MAG: hypothetical protein IRZ02_04305 [Acidothermus sp.]|nr:hypothetical protein [Acidothermus sp.]MCL6537244.1 DUF6457 domain-containing protein [Acidothermus sp.]